MPSVRDLLLVGGGHSHIQVLKRFAMRPVPGLRLTLVSREIDSPYSGMLPGHVAGFYERDELHFDLGKLCVLAGARLVRDEVTGLDLQGGAVELAEHPALRFDLLSLNTGGVPVGVSEHVTPVKPIGRFLPSWERVRNLVEGGSDGQSVVIVGGGAGGVELALAMRGRLPASTSITVLCTTLLPGMGSGAVERLRAVLAKRRVAVLEDFRVVSATAAALSAEDGRTLQADHVFWVTGVSAPPFLRASGLELDDQGFVVVNEHLQSTSHPQVFATGDVAALLGQPRPKAGVFAVREGPVLAENLKRAVLDKPLKRYRAQDRYLVLVGTGDRRAVASRGDYSTEGRWVWWWKDFIDRRFMRKFNRLPAMAEPPSPLPPALRADAPDPMRCGGCGAKLGASPLLRVLSRLPDQAFSQVSLGIGDDAALIRAEGDVILTVDGFRSLVSDPYLFGRITAHHSLNDVLAMGGRPVSALALATVPVMAEAMMEDDLFQMLKGAVDVLNAHGAPLVGGHSAEGAELSLALTVTGALDGRPLLAKGGLLPGQALLLTKGLGSGTNLAAHMRGELASAALVDTLKSLDQSNASAMAVLRDFGVTAATDVSGFGLAGHLSEMLRASGCGAELWLDRVPALPGALDNLKRGITSSLQSNNLQALDDFKNPGADTARAALLADPQTAGGLLASVPWDARDGCLAALKAAGYERSALVGRVAENGALLKASADA